MKTTNLRSIAIAAGVFFTMPDSAWTQIEEVHTSSGGFGLRTLTGVRHNAGSTGIFDGDEAPDADDFLIYDEVVTSSSHLDATGGLPALDANARASAEAILTSSSTSLSFSASGDSSISATRTGGESDDFSGAGGVSSMELTFTLTERCSYQFSAIAFVSTNGRTGSSNTEVQFGGTGDDNFEVEFLAEAEDAPGKPLVSSVSKSGFLPPGSYSLSGFTSSSLGDTQAASATSYTMSLSVNAAPVTNPDVQEILWRTPTSGTFESEGNWAPQQIPDSNDSVLFNKPGRYVVDVGTRTSNRVALVRSKVTFANANYTLSALSSDLASMMITGNGELTLDGGTLNSRHLILGDIGSLSSPGKGLLNLRNGAKLTATGQLSIGGVGKGTFFVEEGSTAISATAVLGSSADGSIATVADANTIWQSGNLKLIGFFPRLLVARGAHVTSGDVLVDTPSSISGANMTVTGVTDDGKTSSRWDIQRLTANNGFLTVEKNGHLTANAIVLGDKAFHFAQIDIAGKPAVGATTGRAQLDVATSIVVGGLGRGRLAINEGGLVTVQGNVAVSGLPDLAQNAPGNGEVFLTGPSEVVAPRSQLLITGALQMGAGFGGKGSVILTNGSVLSCGSAEIGLGTGSFSGIEIANTSPGAFTPRMEVAGNMQLGFPGAEAVVALTNGELNVGGDLIINANSSIQGTGVVNVAGTLHLNSNGLLSPGLSPGVLTINGNVAVESDGIIDAEVAGPETANKSDQVIINGDLAMGGVVRLRFINGYAPRQGQAVKVLNVAGVVTGEPANVQVSGLAAGAAFEVDVTNGVLTATALNDTVALPVVSLAIAPKKIHEKLTRAGALVFKRTGPITAPLTANYSVQGTATNGSDYLLLTGTIIFPAKKKTVTLRVRPLDDLEPEGPESILIKVLPGDGYTPALKGSAKVQLTDNERKK